MSRQTDRPQHVCMGVDAEYVVRMLALKAILLATTGSGRSTSSARQKAKHSFLKRFLTQRKLGQLLQTTLVEVAMVPK